MEQPQQQILDPYGVRPYGTMQVDDLFKETAFQRSYIERLQERILELQQIVDTHQCPQTAVEQAEQVAAEHTNGAVEPAEVPA